MRTGSTLMYTEDSGDAVYVVISGTLKVCRDQADGSGVILALLGPGATVGELSLLDNAGRSADVVAIESSALLAMGRGSFDACLQTMPALAHNLIRLLTHRLRLANAQIETLASQDVFGRVARQLLALTAAYGETLPHGGVHIPLRLTQSDLAELVGASRVRVNQVMVFYRDQGHLTVDKGHHITIHDAAALAAHVQ